MYIFYKQIQPNTNILAKCKEEIQQSTSLSRHSSPSFFLITSKLKVRIRNKVSSDLGSGGEKYLIRRYFCLITCHETAKKKAKCWE